MSDNTLDALVAQVRDENQPSEARRDALRHIASLRGESATAVASIPVEDLSNVVSAITVWSKIGLKDLSLQAAVEAVAGGRARARQSGERKV